jgi:hypothetical protein
MLRYVSAVTGTDVSHSYAVTQPRIKIDAIPGRLNQFESEYRSPVLIMGSAPSYAALAMALCQ